VITQQAEELAVELIVIGSHSHSMPNSSGGLGRTCQRLLQEVRIPIYVVPIRPDMTFVL
jgi:nucleotide-binding universal stress UspA family protein